jgi:hypothetical protein
MKEEIKYYSYQDPNGNKYFCAQVGGKKLELKKKSFSSRNKSNDEIKYGQKIFVSRPLKWAASIERRKRNLLNTIDDKFNLPRYIDSNGNTVTNEAKKRRLEAAGVKKTRINDSKPTEIGKTGQIDPFAVGRRVVRKSKQLVGQGAKAAVGIADNAFKMPSRAILTPGRLITSAAEESIRNPVAAALTGVSYVAAPYSLTNPVAAGITAVDNLIPDNVQFGIYDRLLPIPAHLKGRLKRRSEQFAQSPAAKKMRTFQWGNVLDAAKSGIESIGRNTPQMQVINNRG